MQGICISSDIFQYRTDVKLAIGNCGGWKRNREGLPDSRVRVLLQSTDVHLIIEQHHADAHTRSLANQPLTLAAGF